MRAEGPLVEHALGTLVHNGALVAGKGRSALLVFEEVLPYLGPDLFQQKPDVGENRIVAQYRVAGLQEVADAKCREAAGHEERDQNTKPK